MRRKKKLKELTIKDNFMFGAVMSEEANCKRLLEMILDFPIERIEISKEKSIVYHPEYKGIRLDVYAKDDDNTHYNVEMQAVFEESLSKRARYYHSQIDMELLRTGVSYTELPDSYVIFICDFDPFGKEKYCYTLQKTCMESSEVFVEDGTKSIFLSTKGKNKEEVPKEMVNFLEFVKADLDESLRDFHDPFVKSLQDSILQIKGSREMEERFMILQEMLRDEHAEGKTEGKAESVVELLRVICDVPKELEQKIMQEKNPKKLTQWLKSAAKAESLEQFFTEMQLED